MVCLITQRTFYISKVFILHFLFILQTERLNAWCTFSQVSFVQTFRQGFLYCLVEDVIALTLHLIYCLNVKIMKIRLLAYFEYIEPHARDYNK